ncbi:3D (Asp-Asp-Asp) domain-containing protein [Marinobacterium stanieri]|uniref:3D (Asp-Asp-Asp) domain-containing protein n=2 Tax=Marinobacterium stanieri TaxID=49186 RepID=A0A1N6T5M4_9GAMM|nr:3D (Asp-Asp-Asp) domain-containing protein [Marinobacterium stanieri]
MSSFVAKCLICMLPLALLAGAGSASAEQRLKVMASAYNSVADQTNDQPNITAWGDKLKPGMKVVAVSRDLIKKGLTHNTMIEIVGLPGRYRVLDKMHRRWDKKIDIYMGTDVDAALEWGVRPVEIRWVEDDS